MFGSGEYELSYNGDVSVLFSILIGEVYENVQRLEKNTFTITGTQTDWNFLNNIQSSFRKDDLQETEEVQGQLNPNYTNFLIE